ncbi:outer membrane protein assembly factor BamA [bacterium]|nr:outer membrane protein assembly factor BamA [bacterium]
MRRLIWHLPVLAALVCFFTAEAAPEKIITRIEIDGVVHTRPEEVRAVITVQPGDDLDRLDTLRKIERDQHRILAQPAYKNAAVLQKETEAGWVLIYVVEELPRITKLDFDGNLSIDDDKLRKELGFDAKEPPFADENQIERLRQKLLAVYREKGFPFREVIAESKPIDERSVAVTFHVREGRKLVVEAIRFSGASAFSERKLRSVMKTKKGWWFLKQKFNEDMYQADLEQLRLFYYSQGYLDAQVARGEDRISGENITLSIDIQEGPLYYVRRRSVQGNTIFSSDEILALAGNRPGEVFRYDTLVNEDIPRIEALYKDQGFVRVNVNAPYQVNPDEAGTVDVVYLIQEANRAKLGKIRVHGVMSTAEGEGAQVVRVPLYTKDYVIRRKIPLSSGEVLDWSKVREADKALARMGGESRYFETREPVKTFGAPMLKHGFTLVPTDDPEIVDLLLELEERENIRYVTFGGGYSTSFGPFVAATLRDPNVFGYGQNLVLSSSIGTRRTRISLSLMEPYFRGTDTSVNVQLFHQARDQYRGRTFDESRTGLGVTFGRNLADHLSTTFGYLFEEVEISKIEDDIYTVLSLPSFYENRKSSTSSLNAGLAYDTREFDYLNTPISGRVLSGIAEVAGLGGTNDFVKFTARGDFYRQLAAQWFFQTSSRFMVGAGFGETDELPLQERFFIGGTSTVRGFEDFSLGPRDQLIRYRFPGTSVSQSIREVFVGAEMALYSQNELHYRFNKLFTGVTFLDWGAAYEQPGDFDLSELRFSTGVGLRVRLPIGGVVEMDFAVPLRSEDDDEEDNFHFTFGAGFGF